MSQMIRKQIYIQKRQNTQLKRMAKSRGVSEAEIIREAIDQKISGGVTQVPKSDPEALEKLFLFARSRRRLAGGEPYKWNRADAYEEREEALAAHHAPKTPK
jgi:hypothetical protein